MTLRLVRSPRIHVVRADEALPFTPDAVVVEQDTWLALAPPRDVLELDPDPLRTLTKAHDVEPHPIGHVSVDEGARGARPALVTVVVLDLDADPPCTVDAVAVATAALVDACRRQGLTRVRVPLLGVRGRVEPGAAERAMRAALEAADLDVALVLPSAP